MSGLSNRELFFRFQAQTSPAPLALEIQHAGGCWLTAADGRKYLDLISGISVSNTGHRHPRVIRAIQEQLDKYMHLMVYGELIQSPQVKLAEKISDVLGGRKWVTYLVNSGSEATEGAMKLAKRYTCRTNTAAFNKAYHGSTQGALSLIGDAMMSNPFRPLIPGVTRLELNNHNTLSLITEETAAVFWEPVQGEAGVVPTEPAFAQALRKRCDETGTLLVADEIQSGFGRTGKWFAFQHFGIMPDIVLMAKGMGGGMPIGAFAASGKVMSVLAGNPVLGHITTFGGHPVCSAAALQTINVVEEEKLAENAVRLANELVPFFESLAGIAEVRAMGAMMSIKPVPGLEVPDLIRSGLEEGLLMDWFLFNPDRIRIAPPLIMGDAELQFTKNAFRKIFKQA